MGRPAVVCDDDQILRKVIVRLLTDLGYDVVAETDNAREAIDLADRYQARDLILDLALPGSSGEDALELLRSRNLQCRTTVFSAFTDDHARLQRAGATAVVQKPDFAALEEVLRRASTDDPDGADDNHRRPRHPRAPMPVPEIVSPSGLVPAAGMRELATALTEGDAVLALRVSGADAAVWGELLAADHLLEAARAARRSLRLQDRLGTWDGTDLLIFLVDGFPDAAPSAYQRIERAWRDSVFRGVLQGGWAMVSAGEAPSTTVRRALAALWSIPGTDATLAAG